MDIIHGIRDETPKNLKTRLSLLMPTNIPKLTSSLLPFTKIDHIHFHIKNKNKNKNIKKSKKYFSSSPFSHIYFISLYTLIFHSFFISINAVFLISNFVSLILHSLILISLLVRLLLMLSMCLWECSICWDGMRVRVRVRI